MHFRTAADARQSKPQDQQEEAGVRELEEEWPGVQCSVPGVYAGEDSGGGGGGVRWELPGFYLLL